jgi:hypothetical protein
MADRYWPIPLGERKIQQHERQHVYRYLVAPEGGCWEEYNPGVALRLLDGVSRQELDSLRAYARNPAGWRRNGGEEEMSPGPAGAATASPMTVQGGEPCA